MTKKFLTASLSLALAAPLVATAAFAEKTADVERPALTTESTEALIKQREKWGDKPSLSSADAVKQAGKK
ncbi:MAG: hypothetical protein AAFV45_04925 [Pseudomonadota bacterium]